MRKGKPYLFYLLLVSLVVFSTSMYGVVAKYVHTESLKSSITISGELVEDISLVENEAIITNDGSYMLTSKEVKQNSYTVMPGVDIPKNPHFIVTKKSNLPAFLFIEVVSDAPAEVTFDLTDKWLDLGVKGVNNGDVYVYSTDGVEPLVLDNTFTENKVKIILDDTIYVSDKAKAGSAFNINIFGFLLQQFEDMTATEIFANFTN